MYNVLLSNYINTKHIHIQTYTRISYNLHLISMNAYCFAISNALKQTNKQKNIYSHVYSDTLFLLSENLYQSYVINIRRIIFVYIILKYINVKKNPNIYIHTQGGAEVMIYISI